MPCFWEEGIRACLLIGIAGAALEDQIKGLWVCYHSCSSEAVNR